MTAAGASDGWTGPMVGGHLFGGTIMDSHPQYSVCNGYGRAHDIPNLVLADSGLFPGGSGTSPTFAIYAIAERSSAPMLAHWNDYAGPGARH